MKNKLPIQISSSVVSNCYDGRDDTNCIIKYNAYAIVHTLTSIFLLLYLFADSWNTQVTGTIVGLFE